MNIPAAPSARDRILHTAHDLFYRDGIRATGIDRVIAEAGVTKATFYRHFPSKHVLVMAFLDARHGRWMKAFDDALARHHGEGTRAVAHALREWFQDPVFRGCAFINAVVELGGSEPEVEAVARRHKRHMTDSIRMLLQQEGLEAGDADAIALAVDGAIVQAQYTRDAEAALRPFERLVGALQHSGSSTPGTSGPGPA